MGRLSAFRGSSMPTPIPTREDLKRKLVHTRAAMILAEDIMDWESADEARALCDKLLDTLSEAQAS